MRQERRIPTIFALLILLFGFGGVVALIERPLSTKGLADASKTPHDVRFTNLTDSSATISWYTDGPTIGSIVYQEQGEKRFVSDNRDQSGMGGTYHNHAVTIYNLIAETSYTFTIFSSGKSFDDNGKPYRLTTYPQASSSPPIIDPSYGKIFTPTNEPAKGALVFLNAGGSAPLSTFVKETGEWLIPVSTARTFDGKTYRLPTKEDQIEITVRGEDNSVATVLTTIQQDSPVPDVTLGKTYDFRQTTQIQFQNKNVLGAESSQPNDPVEKSTVAIIAPTHNSALTTARPLIRGTGIQGKIVRIIVESKPQVGETTVGYDGFWSWAPVHDLSPGTHIVTIRTTDAIGKEVVKTQRFIVLKSGTQVLGDATPSASLTPTATVAPLVTSTPFPTIVISPTLVLFPTSTPQIPAKLPMPRSGNTEFTLFSLGLGFSLFVLGILYYLHSQRIF